MKKENIKKIAGISIIILSFASVYFIADYFFKYLLKRELRKNRVVKHFGDMTVSNAKTIHEGKQWMARMPFERMEAAADDGVKLAGYFLPAAKITGRTVISIHGYRCEGAINYKAAKIFHELGFNVFLADNRAHGESGGEYIGMGVLDARDYLLWIDEIVKRIGGGAQIVLHGVSMGAAVCLILSGSKKLPPHVKCVISDCAFTSLYEQLKHQFKHYLKFFEIPIPHHLIYASSFIAKRAAGFSYWEANTVKNVKKSKIPILFIHGEYDSFVPTSMAYELFHAANCSKEIWICPKAKHGASVFVDYDTYKEKVSAFSEKYTADNE